MITAMGSKEGEIVAFKAAVSISENPSINGWLTKVEEMMAISLKMQLEGA